MKADDGPEGFLREMTVDAKVEIDRHSTSCARFPTGYVPIVVYLLIVPITIAIAAFAVPEEFAVKRFDSPKLNTWIGTIKTSDKIEKINQFLRLELLATSKFADRVSFERSVDISVKLNVRKDGGPWKTVIQASHRRDLICREQKKQCDSIHLLDQIALDYEEYSVEVEISKEMDSDFVKAVEYKFSYIKSQFTLCEMFVKYAFIVVTLWRLVDFGVRAQKAQKRSFCCNKEALLEQKLSGFLLVGLLFFNDPLFFCKILVGGWWIDLVSDIMLSTFACIILIYILLMAGHLQREQREDKQTCCFYFSSIVPALAVMVLTLLLIGITRGTAAVDPASDFPSDYGFLYKALTWLLYGFVLICVAMFFFRVAAASFAGLIFMGPSRRQLKDMDELNYFDVTWPEHRRNRFSFFTYMTLFLFALLALLALWSNMEFQFSAKVLSNKNGAIMFGGLTAINLYVFMNAWAFTAVKAQENGPKDSDFLGQTSWVNAGKTEKHKPFTLKL